MNIRELIDLAGARSGSLGQLAIDLDRHQSRLSEWKNGKRKPDASEIAALADKAGLPILETVAEIETQIRPDYAPVWGKAMQQASANGMKVLTFMLPR